MKLDVVIPAAGVGKRMNAGFPKQYLKLGDKTILERTVSVFMEMTDVVSDIIVVISSDDERFKNLGLEKDSRIKVCFGGAERINSVLNGLHCARSEYVMVHDAARPCVLPDDIIKLIDAGCNENGAILVSRVADTMKRTDENNSIITTVSRERLYHALTPQLFNRKSLISAYEKAVSSGIVLTDEASAMESAGFSPRAVVGQASNIKVTEPFDMKLAEFFLKLNNRW
ncbi:MAG: 2-C-methyl-D-erythritol 4-phosphate cytidylyltransferase [Ruminobacter sp.]|uniref:2-C-methyl-D-erythritol 4-phosphate cytidylyltransferase n=1 Tax=Ruminobacter sp. TaxID=2774296 RepID=UPI001B0D915B|nr:2-C-methyl-D-erythritol 4-phosphate cytidylyltransferase [Ruminobacter sp.]MBO6009585.1 2-C-methyl-D-erythritol 4-phosphate cytidylyltransferase [Ruminobacter sp.]MBP3748836.1 2-C-methyl-D-erythritol 4-phosphate cytidylyltransferase [Ruminobacter sp.]